MDIQYIHTPLPGSGGRSEGEDATEKLVVHVSLEAVVRLVEHHATVIADPPFINLILGNIMFSVEIISPHPPDLQQNSKLRVKKRKGEN